MITGDFPTNEDKPAGLSKDDEDVQEMSGDPDDANKNNNKERKTSSADEKAQNSSKTCSSNQKEKKKSTSVTIHSEDGERSEKMSSHDISPQKGTFNLE